MLRCCARSFKCCRIASHSWKTKRIWVLHKSGTSSGIFRILHQPRIFSCHRKQMARSELWEQHLSCGRLQKTMVALVNLSETEVNRINVCVQVKSDLQLRTLMNYCSITMINQFNFATFMKSASWSLVMFCFSPSGRKSRGRDFFCMIGCRLCSDLPGLPGRAGPRFERFGVVRRRRNRPGRRSGGDSPQGRW